MEHAAHDVPPAATATATPDAASGRADASLRCPNCHTPFPPVLPPFCGGCGQETVLRIPTVADFVREFGGHYLSSQGALWRTLRLLFVPAALTREYMAGRRRHYLLPLRLFLSLVVTSVVVGHLTEPAAKRIQTFGDVVEGANYMVRIFNLQVGQQDGRFVCEGLPEERCAPLRQRWERDPQVLKELRRQQYDAWDRQESWLLLAMTPLLAVLMAGVYRARRQAFGFHMVCSLHLSGAWLALATLHQLAHGSALSAPLGKLLLGLGALLGVATLQRLHGGRWWVTGLRVLALYSGYVVTLGLVMAGGLWWATRSSFY
ncbi:DUF3667 domain-containing protein [Roseateles sp. DB2]|uniref:DUF3667 domain-containing protein n=1 Tax=Roseateles sp. DB2 TaxID=3453717 RepID=UPI003EEFDF1F